MTRQKPAQRPKPQRCERCALDCGWDLSDPADPKPCDHGALERAVAAAEARDRALAAQRARANRPGQDTP